jgi:hypothetical protein
VQLPPRRRVQRLRSRGRTTTRRAVGRRARRGERESWRWRRRRKGGRRRRMHDGKSHTMRAETDNNNKKKKKKKRKKRGPVSLSLVSDALEVTASSSPTPPSGSLFSLDASSLVAPHMHMQCSTNYFQGGQRRWPVVCQCARECDAVQSRMPCTRVPCPWSVLWGGRAHGRAGPRPVAGASLHVARVVCAVW